MIKNNYVEKLITILFIILFVALVYLKNVLNANIPIFILTIIVSIYLFISKKSIAEILAFIIPFSSAIQGNYIILIAFVFYFFRKKFKINLDGSFILLLIILSIEAINSLNPYSTIKELISFIMLFSVLYLIVSDEHKDAIGVIKSNLLGTFLSIFVFLLKTLANVPFKDFVSYRFRLGRTSIIAKAIEESYILHYNSNELGLMALVSISLLIFLKYKKKMSDLSFYVGVVFFLLIGFLTMSRAFLLGLFIYFILYLYSNRKKIMKLIISLLIIFFLIIVLYGTNSSAFDTIINNYSNRFNENDITGGRTTILAYYNDIIFSSPRSFLLGSGTQNYNLKNNYYITSHNFTQELFICWGIIGGLSFIILFYIFYLKYKIKQMKYDFNYFLPLLSLLFFIQTIPFLSQGLIILLFYVVLSPFSVPSD